MVFPRRKCCVFWKKLMIALTMACCCVSLLNWLCFMGECEISENKVSSSLSYVVLQANKLSSADERSNGLFNVIPTATVQVEPQKKQLDVAKKMKSLNLSTLDFYLKRTDFLRNKSLLVGMKEPAKGKRFLSVGIPSISRKTKPYLTKTLTSIFNAIRENKNVTIVVFLADVDETFRQRQLSEMLKRFDKYITSGLLQVIQAPSEYYLPLQDLHRSLGDHMDRVLWRSKQVLDYVYLMCYCSYLSQYYLQLEDDVITSPSFISKIHDFIDSQKTEWISLNVALLGYIGKLYPARELQNLASYLRLFFDEMPVDWLEPRWKKYRGVKPEDTKCRDASLFQHVGLVSSFRPKESQRPNTMKEHYFDKFDHKYLGGNPPAEVTSDLFPIYGNPSDAYCKGPGYFYARFSSAGNKVVDIYLKVTAKLKRIVVETGANFAERDFILTGTLQVGQIVVKRGVCTDYESVGEFRFGRVDVTLDGRSVRCVRVNIVYQGRWIYFREINIWTS